MKFSKASLIDLAWEGASDFEGKELKVIQRESGDKRRWSTSIHLVFSYDGKFYTTFYDEGNTEYQDQDPYEFEPDEIECKEVFAKEKTVVVYE